MTSSLFKQHICLDCGSTNTIGVQGYNIHVQRGDEMVLKHFWVTRENDGTLKAGCTEVPGVEVKGTHLLEVLMDLKERLSIP